jgi:hypothetical protein
VARGESRRERAGAAAGLHRDGQVVRLVLEHGVEAPRLEHEIDAGERMSELQGRAAPARHERETLFVRETEQRSGLLQRRRRHGPAWLDPVDGGAALTDVLGADDGAQGIGERDRRRHRHRTTPTSRSAAWDATGGTPHRTPDARARAS